TFNLVDPNGNAVPFARQTDGTYLNKTDPTYVGAVFRAVSGGSTLRLKDGVVLGFQPFPRMGGSMLTSITDANGNVITLTRNFGAPFDVTEVADPVGRTLQLDYDAAGHITSITDPIGRTVSYTYANGLLDTFTNLLGKKTKYTYTAKGEL